MEVLFLVGAAVVFLFGFVLFYGAPYLPTHTTQVELILKLLDMKQGEVLYELGCGDGKIVVAAARAGYRVVGYELNPLLYMIARLRTRHHRQLATIKFGNFWRADLSEADGVYVFLLDRFMPRLNSKLAAQLPEGKRLVSYTFKIPGKKTVHTEAGLFVYQY